MGGMKTKQGVSERLIVGLVILISMGANLPDDLIDRWGVNRNYLLLGLIATVVVALLLYLKFSLFLVIVMMAVGTNLLGDVAARLIVSPTAMLIALVVMVGISLWKKPGRRKLRPEAAHSLLEVSRCSRMALIA